MRKTPVTLLCHETSHPATSEPQLVLAKLRSKRLYRQRTASAAPSRCCIYLPGTSKQAFTCLLVPRAHKDLTSMQHGNRKRLREPLLAARDAHASSHSAMGSFLHHHTAKLHAPFSWDTPSPVHARAAEQSAAQAAGLNFCPVTPPSQGMRDAMHCTCCIANAAGLVRRQGLARRLMDLLEEVTIKVHDGYFVDLFVRASNASAISMYNKARGPSRGACWLPLTCTAFAWCVHQSSAPNKACGLLSRGACGLLLTCQCVCLEPAPSPLHPTRHAACRVGHSDSC